VGRLGGCGLPDISFLFRAFTYGFPQQVEEKCIATSPLYFHEPYNALVGEQFFAVPLFHSPSSRM
jgi:hypothetical protein